VLLGVVAYGVHVGGEALLGTSVAAQAVAVGLALAAGVGAYAIGALALRVEEARYLQDLVTSRVQGRRRGGR
jgi:hypothetical protein